MRVLRGDLLGYELNGDANTSYAIQYAMATVDHLRRLAERVRRPSGTACCSSTIANCDGLVLLERVAEYQDEVVYVDPGYTTADHSSYVHRKVDVLALTARSRRKPGAWRSAAFADES